MSFQSIRLAAGAAVMALAGCGENPTWSPSRGNGELVAEGNVVRVDVGPSGEYVWNGAKVADAELGNRLLTIAKLNPQPGLHIQPHPSARYPRVAHVMSAAQKAGMTDQALGVIYSTQ